MQRSPGAVDSCSRSLLGRGRHAVCARTEGLVCCVDAIEFPHVASSQAMRTHVPRVTLSM